jgi:type IVB pilus formation R64 PilN family outer membrane protein
MMRWRLAPTLTLLLGACTNHVASQATLDQLEHRLAQVPDKPDKLRPIRPSGNIYLGSTAAPADRHGDSLPERLEQAGFVFETNEPLDIRRFADRLAARTGIPVVVIVDDKPKDSPRSIAELTPPKLLADAKPEPITAELAAAEVSPHIRIPFFQGGRLSEFLDQTVNRFGVDWQFEDGTLYLVSATTQIYRVADLAGTTMARAGLEGSGVTPSGTNSTTSPATSSGTTGTGDSGGQSTDTTAKLDSWGEVVATVSLLAGGSGNVVASQANGVIAVHCPRYCQDQVKTFLSTHNRQVGREVLITLTILTVQRTGADDYGFDPTLLYQNLPTGYSLSLVGQSIPVPATGTPSTISTAIINPPPGSTAAKFAGSNLAIQAVSQAGHVTGRFDKTFSVPNGFVYAVRHATDVPVTVSSGSNLASSGVATTASSVQQLVIGDQVLVRPRLGDDGFITLELTLSRTSIQQFVTINLGGGVTTQFPQLLDDSASPQRFTVRDGSTILLSELGDDTSNLADSGTFSPMNFLLGGSNQAQTARDKTVVIVSVGEKHPGETDAAEALK